jgi:hypothetical protein
VSEHKITPAGVTYEARLSGVENVTAYLGNGRREIEPVEAEVTVLSYAVHVTLRGPHITRTGERRGYQQVGWTIGGRWDQSADAPPIVTELIAALVPSPEAGR